VLQGRKKCKHNTTPKNGINSQPILPLGKVNHHEFTSYFLFQLSPNSGFILPTQVWGPASSGYEFP
jgi:hypothetical protein